MENPQDSTKILLKLVNTFNKSMQNKIKIQISVTFLYSHTNWQKEELRKQSHLQSYEKGKIPRNEFNQGDKDSHIKN